MISRPNNVSAVHIFRSMCKSSSLYAVMSFHVCARSLVGYRSSVLTEADMHLGCIVPFAVSKKHRCPSTVASYMFTLAPTEYCRTISYYYLHHPPTLKNLVAEGINLRPLSVFAKYLSFTFRASALSVFLFYRMFQALIFFATRRQLYRALHILDMDYSHQLVPRGIDDPKRKVNGGESPTDGL